MRELGSAIFRRAEINMQTIIGIVKRYTRYVHITVVVWLTHWSSGWAGISTTNFMLREVSSLLETKSHAETRALSSTLRYRAKQLINGVKIALPNIAVF